MKKQKNVLPRAGEVLDPMRANSIIENAAFLGAAVTIAEAEARKILHASSELWIRAIQPALWLLVFGEALSKVRGIVPQNFTYLQFISAGILAQSVLFIAIFYGVTLVWERDLGLLSRLLASPAPRISIVLGKSLAASIRGIFQATIIFGISLILGININLDPLNVAGVYCVVVLLSMCFSTMSMAIASLAKTRERMMGLSQVITFPLFFASNAIYPSAIMPEWLRLVSTVNPLTYGVNALRAIMLTGRYAMIPTDIAVLALYLTLFIALATISISRIIR